MNQYLKALNNQGLLCSFWEHILEKGLIPKGPRETTGTTEVLHANKAGKNSKVLSKQGLSEPCYYRFEWKANMTADLS